MQTKFSEDVIPLTALKLNPAKVIRQTAKSHRPILVTSRGKGLAVILSLEDFEKIQEELEPMRNKK
jgi:prevent-host-death family protein